MMYHDNPNRAAPNSHSWFLVETPSVFHEVKLPACSADWTRADKRKHRLLEDLAETHGTHVRVSSFRRG
jgi:hypothetical protein